MTTCVALRHVPFESLGALGPLLDERDAKTEVVDVPLGLGEPSVVLNADLLVVLGGPIGAYETETYPFLSQEVELIRTRLRADRPVIGICLGAQLMAAALGAAVYKGAAKELGWSKLTLTDEGQKSVLSPIAGLSVLHWHGDTFDLPERAVRLASTPATPNQAFGLGRRCLGLQFHLEVDTRSLEAWYVGHAVELGLPGAPSINELRRQAQENAGRLAPAARLALGAALDQLLS